MRKSQWINHYAPRDQVCRVLWTWEQCQMWSWATLNCSVPFSDSTRWSMHSLKKNLLEWRWIWTISFGIMWSLANSFSINQLGLWWPISKSSWRIWILRGCRIQTQIDPQSSDESIVSINVWSFVTICGQHLSMFRGWNPFLLGIASSKNNSVLRTRLLS
jgi:hypothetical protein